jgi:phage tail-like protein
MARPKATDFLHNFRFYVEIAFPPNVAAGVIGPGAGPGSSVIAAGFSAASIPEVSQDAVEYREGHYIYTQKYVGLPTLGTVSLSRGVTVGDTSLWIWMKSVVEGNEEYRGDMSIYHLHRNAKQGTSATGSTMNQMTKPLATQGGYKLYQCSNVFPIRFKASGDLDGTGSDISIQEIELAVEYIEVSDHPSILP